MKFIDKVRSIQKDTQQAADEKLSRYIKKSVKNYQKLVEKRVKNGYSHMCHSLPSIELITHEFYPRRIKDAVEKEISSQLGEGFNVKGSVNLYESFTYLVSVYISW